MYKCIWKEDKDKRGVIPEIHKYFQLEEEYDIKEIRKFAAAYSYIFDKMHRIINLINRSQEIVVIFNSARSDNQEE
jgi:hypothetical protein